MSAAVIALTTVVVEIDKEGCNFVYTVLYEQMVDDTELTTKAILGQNLFYEFKFLVNPGLINERFVLLTRPCPKCGKWEIVSVTNSTRGMWFKCYQCGHQPKSGADDWDSATRIWNNARR